MTNIFSAVIFRLKRYGHFFFFFYWKLNLNLYFIHFWYTSESDIILIPSYNHYFMEMLIKIVRYHFIIEIEHLSICLRVLCISSTVKYLNKIYFKNKQIWREGTIGMFSLSHWLNSSTWKDFFKRHCRTGKILSQNTHWFLICK